ncbi:hypothetical protein ACSV5M_06930 [Cellvibrio sp. ARAG 10.3]|uniref:hypothetical protein n=1 Tax=Cellvibrio sp. ARAG 10.3 TaxID=3451358 RepID=UPI003F485303
MGYCKGDAKLENPGFTGVCGDEVSQLLKIAQTGRIFFKTKKLFFQSSSTEDAKDTECGAGLTTEGMRRGSHKITDEIKPDKQTKRKMSSGKEAKVKLPDELAAACAMKKGGNQWSVSK